MQPLQIQGPCCLAGFVCRCGEAEFKKKKWQRIDKELQIIPLKIQWHYFLLFVNSSGPMLCH